MTKESINPNLIEKWIEEFLIESEISNIPSSLMRLNSKIPLERYQISRDRLKGLNISNENIDRLYNCLFVYSVGFYEVINEILAHVPDRNILISQVWVV